MEDKVLEPIDFNNAESIASAAKEFVSSHDLLSLDFSGYRKCQIGDEDDISKYPAIKELINKLVNLKVIM